MTRFPMFFMASLLMLAAPAAAQDLKAPPSEKDEVESPGTAEEESPPDETTPVGVTDQARLLYMEGRKAFNTGDFKVAVEKFKKAYDLSNKPALLYNIAFAHDKAKNRQLAIFFFERYLAEDKAAPEERQAEVNARINALKEEKARADDTRAAESARLSDEAARKALAAQTERELALKQAEANNPPLYKRWWLWTIVGAVVAGGVATGVVLGTRPTHAVSPASELGEIRGSLKFNWR